MNQIIMPMFPSSSSPEIIKNAMIEVQGHVQAPMALIYGEMLAAISLTCQDKLLVKLPSGSNAPPSIFTIVVAASGERKSTVDQLVFKPIRDFEKKHKCDAEANICAYEAELEIWDIEHEALATSLTKAFRNGTATAEQKLALTAHSELKPTPPRIPKLIYSDTTTAALLDGLHKRGPSAGIISDEADLVLNGYAARNLAVLNKLRDGASVEIDRKSGESFTLSDVNLTMALMIQPKPFNQFLAGSGKNARDIGFFARCLIAYPESTQGTRFRSGIQDVVWKYLTVFNDRITSILEEGYRNKVQTSRVILELSAEASSHWLSFYNNVESDIGAGHYLCDVGDAASKMAETAVRISALLHFFEGRSGQIQADTFEQARQVCSWYLSEFKRIFGEKPKPPEEQVDAQVLESWFWEVFCKSGCCHPVRKNHVRQYGPNCLRTKNRLNAALFEMVRANKLFFGVAGKTDLVHPNPSYWMIQPAQFQQHNYTAPALYQPRI